MHIFTQTTEILTRKIASISENNITFATYKYKQETSNKSLLSLKKQNREKNKQTKKVFSNIISKFAKKILNIASGKVKELYEKSGIQERIPKINDDLLNLL